QVLHDEEKRKIYDTYGKEGLFASANGAGGGGGGMGGRGFRGPGGTPDFFGGSRSGGNGSPFFTFARGFGGFTDPMELFEDLFGGGGRGRGVGSSGLFGDLFGSPSFDDLPGMHGMGGGRGGAARRRTRSAVPPLKKEFACSLKELYEGCVKKIKVRRKVSLRCLC
ncbi:unnamed protein product, partial [Sphacelaria rigidula]